jgi:hypothetical protein
MVDAGSEPGARHEVVVVGIAEDCVTVARTASDERRRPARTGRLVRRGGRLAARDRPRDRVGRAASGLT